MKRSKGDRYPLGPYGLTIVLAALFAVSWVLQTYAGWVNFQAEQTAHAESAQLFGESGDIWHWLSQTMENWQSEFLPLLTFVTLTAHFVHVGRHEPKDNDDRPTEQLSRIEQSSRSC